MVSIQEDTDRNHALHLGTEFPSKGSWEDDWEGTVPQCVELDFPCFILYRLDEKDASGNYMWILISWSPDIAHTRLKMLYASTKATFKKEFGGGHLKAEAAPGPLTREEEEMKEIKETETRVEISVDT